jgi:ABC-2 type transport system ATP-binding protein
LCGPNAALTHTNVTDYPSGRIGAVAVVVEFSGLTKRFGSLTAVDALTFSVTPGKVTGFLGPNGAGKTTTLRMLLGLVRPTSGTATIDGRTYAELDAPLATVGAALEATDVHPGRTGRDHLRTIAAASGVPDQRVDELLELTGIPAFARKRAGGYSTGMRQRLALAQSLLGDPQLLVLDEPANGLDPEGIRWLRGFLRHLCDDQGKTVLVSSHLLQEVEQTVDDVVIIANGTLVRQGAMSDLAGGAGAIVRTSDPAALARALDGIASEPDGDGALFVHSTDLRAIGDAALAAGLPVWELRQRQADLEALFFELTEGRQRNVGEAV